MKKLFVALFAASLFISTQSQAMSAANQYTADQLANGGPVSIRSAAQSLYHTGEKSTEILDVLAEVMLQNYHKGDRNHIDAISWASRALGNSGNPRYRDVLTTISKEGSHRKLKKYAKKALKQLDSGDAKQYTKGMVSLDKLRKSVKQTAKQQPASPAPAPSGKAQPIDVVKAGMSMEQAYALAGQPTATSSYQTGKAWIPFNYKGGDSARMDALYKGQGRIVFSNESHYSSTWRVLEVRIDPSETGYP